MEFTILMPCLNEEETLASCISKAKQSINRNQLNAEIVVADNGSTDNSVQIAKKYGARVIHVPEKGYGITLYKGITLSEGKYIIMGDSDDSYDFSDLNNFIAQLRSGVDLVMGNRFSGGIKPGAMPFLHRYLGNPVLSFLGKLFFKIPVGDFHCGLRGMNKESILKIGLCTTGMEFASEMIIKANFCHLKITEVPVILYPDGRTGTSHLNTWKDGWRHLRFLLLFSPHWLFLYPGLFFIIAGVITTSRIFYGPIEIGSVKFDIHTMLYSAMLIIIGFQVVSFYIYSRIYALRIGLYPNKLWVNKFNEIFSLEKGIIIGTLMLLSGVSVTLYALRIWDEKLFGNLNPQSTFRLIIPAITLLVVGSQWIFNSFFCSILYLKTTHTEDQHLDT